MITYILISGYKQNLRQYAGEHDFVPVTEDLHLTQTCKTCTCYGKPALELNTLCYYRRCCAIKEDLIPVSKYPYTVTENPGPVTEGPGSVAEDSGSVTEDS